MQSTQNNDAELVRAAQLGDQNAVAGLYNRYFDALYRFCYWQTNKSLDAEDLSQDVMVAMLQALPKFRFEASFRNFLYAIAKRKIAAWMQRKYQLSTVRYEEFIQEIGDDDAWLDDENQVKKQHSIAQLLAKLPGREQKVMRLRYLRGFSHAEIAQKLQITVSNVKVICHRCIHKLAGSVK